MRIIMLLAVMTVMVACSNDGGSSISKLAIQEKLTTVNFVKHEDEIIASFDFVVWNQSKETVGPFDTKLIFHGTETQEYFGMKEYSLQLLQTLRPNESIRLGGSVISKKGNVEDMMKHAKNNYEIQLIDVETEQVLATQVVTKFNEIAPK